jgi:ankyrin repeat protein
MSDSEGTTPFHVALIKGDTLMAKILLDSLPTTMVSTVLRNGRLNLDQLLLYHAGFPDSTEAMEFLLDLGANINTLNSNHETSLMLATLCGNFTAMKLL